MHYLRYAMSYNVRHRGFHAMARVLLASLVGCLRVSCLMHARVAPVPRPFSALLTLCYAMLWYAMLCYAVIFCAILCFDIVCRATLRYAIYCSVPCCAVLDAIRSARRGGARSCACYAFMHARSHAYACIQPCICMHAAMQQQWRCWWQQC